MASGKAFIRSMNKKNPWMIGAPEPVHIKEVAITFNEQKPGITMQERAMEAAVEYQQEVASAAPPPGQKGMLLIGAAALAALLLLL